MLADRQGRAAFVAGQVARVGKLLVVQSECAQQLATLKPVKLASLFGHVMQGAVGPA